MSRFEIARSRVFLFFMVVAAAVLTGCAGVPMASKDADNEAKTFKNPPDGKAGLYVYRNSHFGAALTKRINLDGVPIGESAAMTYFFRLIEPGSHTLSTQSEFSDNELTLDTRAGQNYFVHQYIKMGVFVGGANLEIVDEATGKQGVAECQMASPFTDGQKKP